jgi:catechol 2,3-dioxygenase-like lactoylglutathione lyase family enzyme
MAGAALAGVVIFAQTPPKGPVVGILHALHATTSVETTAAFYRDVFGFAGDPRPFPNPAVPLLTNSPGVSLRNLIYRMTFAGFNYELTEFTGVERRATQAQVTDPGAMRLTFVVRELDPVVAALKTRGASVLTLGGRPVAVGKGASAHRVFVVRDPDGFIVEVEEDANATPQLGRVAAVRMGITAKDVDETLRFWNGQLGFELKAPKGFAADPALAALGVVGPVTTRTARGVVPGTTAAIAFTQFKGAPEGRVFDLRVPDPGAAGMAIRVQHVDDFLPALRAAGYRVISKDGVPVQFAANSRNVFVKDPNGLNVELVDAPAAAPRPAQTPQPAPRTAQPIKQEDLPQRRRPVPTDVKAAGYVPPKTTWGDPQVAGVYTSSDESGVPFERPAEFDGRTLRDITPAELAVLNKRRQAQTIERAPTLSEFPGATSPMHWFEFYNAANSHAWLVSDPPDGHVPPTTPEADARASVRAAQRAQHGPADSWEDRSLWDRCITRGIPTSMLPTLYGNSYEFHQGPGFVAIRYEMVNETRIIPLDNRAHASGKIREYLGDARGHFEGNTLVVETTNFNDKTAYRGSSRFLKMTERFTPVSPAAMEWSATFEDPHTWARPWTFTMWLTHVDDSQRPFEYACNEGNYGLHNILTSARADDKANRVTVDDGEGER